MERAITTQAKDSWGCINSDLPYPLYFYAYSKSEFGNTAYENSIAMSQAPTVQNVMYCPFINFNDLSLVKIPYDRERFGTDPLRPAPAYDSHVYRVKTFETKEKELGYILPYRNINANPGRFKPRSWRNESKLYQYPYRKIFVSDGMNTPLELKTYLLKYDDAQNKLKVRLTISNRMSYGLYVTGYKGDETGLYEAMVSGDSLELPCSSSAYNQWYATSKNQTATQTQQMIQNSFLAGTHQNQQLAYQAQMAQISQRMGATSNMIASSTNPWNPLGFIGAGAVNAQTKAEVQMENGLRAMQSQQNAEMHAQTARFAMQTNLAITTDASTTPPTMVSMGSDFMYGYNNNNQKLKVSTFDITEQVAEQIGDYFSLYGYMANKVMKLDEVIKSRYFYNYVKTTNASVRSKNSVPKVFVDKINAMFNNGVTLWHQDNLYVEMHDYTYDNFERSMF